MIALGGYAGGIVLSNGRFGVRAAEIPTAGDFASPLLDDFDLPADADTEIAWYLKAPMPVHGGTFTINDNGTASLVGASNGSWTFSYDGLAWPQGGPLSTYASTFTITVGAAAVGTAAETDTALALAGRVQGPPGLSAETTTALARTGAVQGLPRVATETSTALALTPGVVGGPGLAVETDTPLPRSGRVQGPPGLATETTTALALQPGGAAPGVASETSTALPLGGRVQGAPGIAQEQSVALVPGQAFSPFQPRPGNTVKVRAGANTRRVPASRNRVRIPINP